MKTFNFSSANIATASSLPPRKRNVLTFDLWMVNGERVRKHIHHAKRTCLHHKDSLLVQQRNADNKKDGRRLEEGKGCAIYRPGRVSAGCKSTRNFRPFRPLLGVGGESDLQT